MLVPEGEYLIGRSITLDAHMRFTGRISDASPGRIAFTANYNYDTYLQAFQDEQVALERALQALYGFTDHTDLDLCGRSIALSRPIDVHAEVGDRDTFGVRRVIHNGQLSASSSSDWDVGMSSSTASYDAAVDQLKLTNVTNIAAVERGSLVQGTGVGREIYVREVDIPNATITLSQPLYAAPASQTYTFTRFRYMLDFSGFTSIQRQCLRQIEFNCGRRASALMLGRAGIAWHIEHCWFVRPKDRGITSIGEGCNGISIESNEFISPETDLNVEDRTAIAVNTNKNDMKIRNNRVVQFLHFAVIAGGGHLLVGNHWWQGDGVVENAARSAGVIFCNRNVKTTMVGNYCDNAFIELTDEYNANSSSNRAYGALTITGNIFTASSIPNWFTYIRLAPIGPDQEIDGITVTDNSFKTIGGDFMDRVESVDDDRGSFDHARTVNVTFTGNLYEQIGTRTASPLLVTGFNLFPSTTWNILTSGRLPFGGRAMRVQSIAPVSTLSGWDGRMPQVALQQQTDGSGVSLTWQDSIAGEILVTVRSDLPS
ncbi:right-handed parallel beta-helix repeat-containing protein [Pontivivens ytuae]|uniref:Right-handed parallel beta-helix repeat-containing protein n=1 Tax=Pontivivens ytuae TaxID=2789856 RepID=A0A7S9LV18_9RHOB|nr:right-handed parallel beta-helix repeat-containing protein [Pontivivens ytuae]QPH55510.1 right-handed parallel beta-helix repeat-containing protein [Pontivivens ytuae]